MFDNCYGELVEEKEPFGSERYDFRSSTPRTRRTETDLNGVTHLVEEVI